MKSTQITAMQYLWDKLDKQVVTDPLDYILKIEKQTPLNHTYTYNEQLKSNHSGTHKK